MVGSRGAEISHRLPLELVRARGSKLQQLGRAHPSRKRAPHHADAPCNEDTERSSSLRCSGRKVVNMEADRGRLNLPDRFDRRDPVHPLVFRSTLTM